MTNNRLTVDVLLYLFCVSNIAFNHVANFTFTSVYCTLYIYGTKRSYFPRPFKWIRFVLKTFIPVLKSEEKKKQLFLWPYTPYYKQTHLLLHEKKFQVKLFLVPSFSFSILQCRLYILLEQLLHVATIHPYIKCMFVYRQYSVEDKRSTRSLLVIFGEKTKRVIHTTTTTSFLKWKIAILLLYVCNMYPLWTKMKWKGIQISKSAPFKTFYVLESCLESKMLWVNFYWIYS